MRWRGGLARLQVKRIDIPRIPVIRLVFVKFKQVPLPRERLAPRGAMNQGNQLPAGFERCNQMLVAQHERAGCLLDADVIAGVNRLRRGEWSGGHELKLAIPLNHLAAREARRVDGYFASPGDGVDQFLAFV